MRSNDDYTVIALTNFRLQPEHLDHFSVAQDVLHNVGDMLHC